MSLSFNTGLDVAKWSHDRYPQSCIYYSYIYSYLHDNFNLNLCTIGKPLIKRNQLKKTGGEFLTERDEVGKINDPKA